MRYRRRDGYEENREAADFGFRIHKRRLGGLLTLLTAGLISSAGANATQPTVSAAPLIFDCKGSGRDIYVFLQGSWISLTTSDVALGSGELSEELPKQYEGLYLRTATIRPDRAVSFGKLRDGTYRLIIKDVLAGTLTLECR